MMTPEQLAWAAGLFEGEGSVRISKPAPRNWGTLIVQVSNTDPEIVAFFQRHWPGYCKRVSGSGAGNRKPAFVWLTASAKARTFLDAIEPYVVTSRVREKIIVGLQFQSTVRQRDSSEEYREDRWTRYWWMAHLNQRGSAGRIDTRDPREIAFAS